MNPSLESAQPILAIDIGGTKLAGGVVSPDGSVHLARTVPTAAWEGGEAVMKRVIDLAQSLLTTSQTYPVLRPVEIGVGTGGLLKLPEGVILSATSAIPNWAGMRVRDRLSEALGMPVSIDTDGNAMVLGEALFGAGKNHAMVIGITVGTGIGGGIAVDGKIFHGAHGFSNNIGHMVLRHHGRLCPCGKRGCLEAYASAPVMVADFTARVGRDRLQADFGLQPGKFGVKELARLASESLPEAIAALQQGADYLGSGIASLINLLDPDIVVIGGGAAQSGDIYFDRLQATVAGQVLSSGARIPIVPAVLKANANLVGAACIAWGKGKNGAVLSAG